MSVTSFLPRAKAAAPKANLANIRRSSMTGAAGHVQDNDEKRNELGWHVLQLAYSLGNGVRFEIILVLELCARS